MMIIMMDTARFQPGVLTRYCDAMAAKVAATEAEAGCIAFRFCLDLTDPALLPMSERRRDQAALTAHVTALYMATCNATLALVQPLSIDVVACDASTGPRPLAR